MKESNNDPKEKEKKLVREIKKLQKKTDKLKFENEQFKQMLAEYILVFEKIDQNVKFTQQVYNEMKDKEEKYMKQKMDFTSLKNENDSIKAELKIYTNTVERLQEVNKCIMEIVVTSYPQSELINWNNFGNVDDMMRNDPENKNQKEVYC